jgi:hypothetical protein
MISVGCEMFYVNVDLEVMYRKYKFITFSFLSRNLADRVHSVENL